jgi:hypothetical protein
MKFRRQAEPPQAFGFMIAPMVDILLVVLGTERNESERATAVRRTGCD